MEDTQSVATLLEATTSKIQQLQKAFEELESHRAVTLNMKWKQLEEHFHGLEKSLKNRFNELKDQEKEYEEKTMKAQEILVKREADVMAKEKALLERLQKKRDAAVFAVTNVVKNHKKARVEPFVFTTDDKGMTDFEDEKPPDIIAPAKLNDVKRFSQNKNVEVKSFPQLVNLCKENDSAGLHKFISDNRKNLAAIKEEIPIAFQAAVDPASLVLDSLQGFYNIKLANLDGKKDSNLLGIRRTCIMLMECLSLLIVNLSLESVSYVISDDVKYRAKAIAEEWKPKLNDLDVDASNGNSLEAHAFLQLLATFGINSDFDQGILCKLIPMVSRRHQTAELCRSLGLSEKMPGVIDVLVSNGREIDAVNLAFAFKLTEMYSPLILLKSYLENAGRVPSPVKSPNSSPTVQNEVNEKELTALKAVIKCIEEHKLHEQYPLDPLQKQVAQLEKAKADKKRVSEVSKPQPKRPRASGIGCLPRVANVAAEKIFYPRMTDRYTQYIYNRSYAYPGPTENHVPSHMGTAAYHLSPAHGNYFGNAYQYPAPYLH